MHAPTSSTRTIYAALFLVFSLVGIACGGGSDTFIIAGSGDIAIVTQPSTDAAGAPLHASFRLLDASGQPFELAGIDIDVTLNKHAFSNGEHVKTATTDKDGIARFEFTIDTPSANYALTATSDHEGIEAVSTSTLYFDVLAGAASADTSAISGTDGVINHIKDATITIELRNAYGVPLTGSIPTFSATGEGNTYGDCSQSDDNGISTCTMGSTETGLKTLQLTKPATVDGETIEFFAWDCDKDGAPFGGGDGESEDTPYRLCTPEQLNAIGDDADHMAKYFVVARDIDMAGFDDFTMIGSEGHPFEGHFDGDHKAIKNLVIHRPDENFVGLFRYIKGISATVKHIVLKNADVTGKSKVGSLVGYNSAVPISDVYATGAVTAVSDDVGGLVGHNNSGSISDSHAACDVEGGGENVGGLVGLNMTASIQDSDATGSVEGAGDNVGGLIGLSRYGNIDDSYATGSVEGAGERVGGLVGLMSKYSIITGSYATGSVDGANDDVGGLVGENRGGDISESHATGDVTAVGAYVGGLVGWNHIANSSSATISRSYATGSVEGSKVTGGLVGYLSSGSVHNSYATGSVTADVQSAGGLVGVSLSGKIEDAYASGHVTGDTKTGGLIGVRNKTKSSTTDSHWDTDTSGMNTGTSGTSMNASVTGLTTADFSDDNNFPNWDFGDVWMIDQAPDGETRPILQWQAE